MPKPPPAIFQFKRCSVLACNRTPKSRRRAGGAKIMLNQKKVFSTKKWIFRRTGGKKSRSIELLFWKDRTAIIISRFDFKNNARMIAEKVFQKKFFRSLKSALKSAR
jgi:hypothetical protein